MKNPEMEQKNEKKFLVLKITAFVSETTNSHNIEQDTCHCQSMFYETPVRINISLREIISTSVSLRVMKKKMMKVLSCRFYKSLRPFNMWTIKGCFEKVFFRQWSNQVFDSL